MSSQLFDLTDQRILLVGSTGVLGRTYAKAIHEAGSSLAIADLPSTDVLTLADNFGAYGIEMDVTDEESVKKGVENAVFLLGGLDGVICNAGATSEFLTNDGNAFADYESYPLSVWKKTIDVNLTGTFLVAREAGRAMKEDNGGSLITVSSIYGLVGPDHRVYENQSFRSLPGYSASKAGVIGLTQWMATWWAEANVRVNSITPGGVFNEHDPSFVEAYTNRTPMGRMADRSELIGIIIFLLSDASSYCTGQNFIVDGGFTAW